MAYQYQFGSLAGGNNVAGLQSTGGIQRPMASVPGRVASLTTFPRPVAVVGLPSPSVGTLLPISRSAPVLPTAAYPFATPSVGASFGQTSATAPASLPRPTSPTLNAIGERQ